MEHKKQKHFLAYFFNHILVMWFVLFKVLAPKDAFWMVQILQLRGFKLATRLLFHLTLKNWDRKQCFLCSILSVPVGNRSTTLDHLVRSPTVPRTTTRGACFRVKLYEGVCELYRKNAVTQDILSQRNLFCVVTNLFILSLLFCVRSLFPLEKCARRRSSF